MAGNPKQIRYASHQRRNFRIARQKWAEKGDIFMSYLNVTWNSFGRGLLARSLVIKACRASPWPLPERRLRRRKRRLPLIFLAGG
jgi:hypothetical protein